MPPSDLYHYRPKICLTRRRTNGKVIYFPSGEERQYLHRPTKTIRGWAPFCPFTRKSGARMGPVGMVELGCTLLTLRQSGMASAQPRENRAWPGPDWHAWAGTGLGWTH